VRPFDPSSSSGESAAAQWLARRDRGLSPTEQDAYLQWLRENPAHGAEVAFLERAWKRLDALHQWHPAHSSQPNPDLLAPRRGRKWLAPSLLGLAAALMFAGAMWWSPPAQRADSRDGVVIHPRPERMVLADGSLVELNAGAKIDVNFSPERRNVRLVNGEAHFTVAKDACRPFVVTADKYTVRAIGTAFTVHLKPEAVSVLVTEGNVQLDEVRPREDPSAATRELSRLMAGQSAIMRTQTLSSTPWVEVRDVTPEQIDQALAWQTMRLEFNDMPLRAVVAEFNRYNSRKLLIEDRATGDIRVGGSFRADNVDPFIRLMDLGFQVSGTRRGNDVVLRRRD
jgi:transmembrane sensor